MLLRQLSVGRQNRDVARRDLSPTWGSLNGAPLAAKTQTSLRPDYAIRWQTFKGRGTVKYFPLYQWFRTLWVLVALQKRRVSRPWKAGGGRGSDERGTRGERDEIIDGPSLCCPLWLCMSGVGSAYWGEKLRVKPFRCPSRGCLTSRRVFQLARCHVSKF